MNGVLWIFALIGFASFCYFVLIYCALNRARLRKKYATKDFTSHEATLLDIKYIVLTLLSIPCFFISCALHPVFNYIEDANIELKDLIEKYPED